MSNKFMNALKTDFNFKLTENGAVAAKSTGYKVLDMFALGGAYRTRSDEDCILLFKEAYEDNPEYALKCLFYLGDARGGQGERRFFRVCMKWLANYDPESAKRNMVYIPEYRRWDDLYMFVNTPLEKDMFKFLYEQLSLDVQSKTPSLLAKWLKSENTSSADSRKLANKTRIAFGMNHKQYRKTLSILRERIRVLEKLMSANRWDEIEFDKLPSKAGLKYKNAFARRDILKAKYEAFAKNKTTKVNAKTLYPYECVKAAWDVRNKALDNTERLMVNKYWDNLADYFNGCELNALAVVDTSASMTWTGNPKPIDVAVSLGMYCAEKAQGPFANNYISFSANPRLVSVTGVDFVDKVKRIISTNLCQNTNLERAFSLILDTAVTHGLNQEDLPETILVISDMEIDQGSSDIMRYRSDDKKSQTVTLMDRIREKYNRYSYKMPKLIYWNVQARQNTILDVSPDASFVSGASPSIFQSIMSGKTQLDLMLDVLNKERYACIK